MTHTPGLKPTNTNTVIEAPTSTILTFFCLTLQSDFFQMPHNLEFTVLHLPHSQGWQCHASQGQLLAFQNHSMHIKKI